MKYGDGGWASFKLPTVKLPTVQITDNKLPTIKLPTRVKLPTIKLLTYIGAAKAKKNPKHALHFYEVVYFIYLEL